MRRDWVSTSTAVLGAILGLGYLAAGVAGWIGDATDGDGSDLFFWLLLLLGGGILVLLGAPFAVAALVGAALYGSRRRPRAPASPATFT